MSLFFDDWSFIASSIVSSQNAWCRLKRCAPQTWLWEQQKKDLDVIQSHMREREGEREREREWKLKKKYTKKGKSKLSVWQRKNERSKCKLCAQTMKTKFYNVETGTTTHDSDAWTTLASLQLRLHGNISAWGNLLKVNHECEEWKKKKKPGSILKVQEQCNGAVVAAHHFMADHVVDKFRLQCLRQHKVVKSPGTTTGDHTKLRQNGQIKRYTYAKQWSNHERKKITCFALDLASDLNPQRQKLKKKRLEDEK